MRRVSVQVARGRGREVLDAARRHEAANLYLHEAEGPEGPQDVVVAHLPNRQVERFFAWIDRARPDARVTLSPRGELTLYPPPDEAPAQATHVQPRSPVEVYLGGLQSVGSWRSFLGFAAAAGLVVWVGLLTGTVYLLVGAMLIAPYAGPVMNAALATARGDATLLGRSLARYAAGLAVSVAVAALMTLLMRPAAPTRLMEDVGALSGAAVVIPLTAGAAGALHLCQSERNSLVSGAAVGLLVAASLAPPAGLVGMSLVLGEWPLAKSGLFLLLLQLAGINAAGALVFRLYGLSPRGARFPRGRAGVARAGAFLTLLALAALLAWQSQDAPDLQRDALARQAADETRDEVRASGLALPVETDARYARGDAPGRPALLVLAHVQRAPAAALPAEEIARLLEDRIRARLAAGGYGATPLVDVTVLEPPRED